MNNLNLTGIAVVTGWIFSGFYAAWYVENKASRDGIPAKLFPFIPLLSLFAGPLVLFFVFLAPVKRIREWKKMKEERRIIPVTFYNEQGDEIFNDPDSGDKSWRDAIAEFRMLISESINLRAEDILFDRQGSGVVKIRFRREGVLHDFRNVSSLQGDNLIRVVKAAAGMEPDECNMPQNGSFCITYPAGRLTMQAASIGTFNGEKLSIHIPLPEKDVCSIGDLPREDGAFIRNALKQRCGLILFAAPDEKTAKRLLYMLLEESDCRSRSVVSIEKTILHPIENVSQLESGSNPCGRLLRNIALQNPDIIGIEEVNDSDGVQVALQSAANALVIAGVRAGDLPSAVSALSGFGVAPSAIGRVLLLAFSLHPIRKLCSCSVGETCLPQDIAEYLAAAELPANGIRRASGCGKCRSGYHGETGIIDLLAVDDRMRMLIESCDSPAQLKEKLNEEHGTVFVAYEAYKLAASGVSSLDEAGRVISKMEQ